MPWTEITRPDYDRRFLRYASDCTDEEWCLIAPFLMRSSKVGRPRTHAMRNIWNAISYIAATGCQWAMLPKDFPPFTTVQYYFYRLRDCGLLDVINEALVGACRVVCDRESQPTAAIIDSQSVKTCESGGISGFDAGKKVKGRKRHIMTDTQGNLLYGTIHAGDLHGLNTLEHQPAKVAAMEANWETRSNVPLVLFALPDEENRSNKFELSIPDGASLILKHDPDGVVPGLNDFIAEDGTVEHPPVAPVFWAFRIMVGTGMAMLVVSWLAGWFIWRKGELPNPIAYILLPMVFSGWIATLAGWYVTEIGRQPWLVSGVLSTKEALGPVAGGMVLSTLLMYLATYVLLLFAYMFVLTRLTLKAAKEGDNRPDPGVAGETALPAPGPNAVLQPGE